MVTLQMPMIPRAITRSPRLFLGLGIVLCVISVFAYLKRCDVHSENSSLSRVAEDRHEVVPVGIGGQVVLPRGGNCSPIDCVINGDYTVPCQQMQADVFLPFSFIAKYFEVSGSIANDGGYPRFEWQHSKINLYYPRQPYEASGVFMYFERYNVEVRDRVLCISGTEGVPVSIQWSSEGYHYPIQIAQYGLSHYSKYLVDNSRDVMNIESGQSIDKWTGGMVKQVFEPETGSRVIEFIESDQWKGSGAILDVPGSTSQVHLAMDIKFASNGSVEVIVERVGSRNNAVYHILYVQTNTFIQGNANNIAIGIGDRRMQWSRVTRDLTIDLQKGLAVMKQSSHKDRSKTVSCKLLRMIFHGHGWVDNVTLSTNEHLAQFYHAANWLVLHQDHRGGWPIPVKRVLAHGLLELAPGWYSAMAQGQAMSLLVRAYVRTRNEKYLTAAKKATDLFMINSENGGVRTFFANRYVWYEEYPTTPSTFVLNGFIYSLLGLYDLKSVLELEQLDMDSVASKLYDEGLASLKALLPLFDTGSGSVYDLRHYTLHIAPNLARWDYHATHINQLLIISSIDKDKYFSETAKRWVDYCKGVRAPHN